MGARWESVFLRGSAEAVLRVVARSRELLPLVRPPIQFSIGAFPCGGEVWSLECGGLRRNSPPTLSELPCEVEGNDLGVPAELAQICTRSCAFGLALVASNLIEDVTWVYSSDSLGHSAFIRVRNGAVVGYEFAQAGSDENSYTAAALHGVSGYLDGVMHVDDELFGRVYSGDGIAWMLLENKLPVDPPRLLESS